MALAFLVLKVFHVVETDYDHVVALLLLGIDLIWLGEWVRIWLHLRGR